MGREERLERVRYLDGIARFYEWVTAALIVGMLTGGVLLEDSVRAAAAATLGASLAVVAAYRAYQLRRHLEDVWAEIMREDPRWVARSPLTLMLMALLAAAGVIVIRLLLG